MKIVTWNCNGGLWKKFKHIDKLEADLLFIQECENPEKSKHKEYQKWAKNYIWIGDNKNKGIGFFAKPDYLLEKLNWSNQYQDHNVKYFLPIRFNREINILGVWAHSNNSPTFGYIGQVWKYLQVNNSNINDSIILGDFNSNIIWDKWDRWWNHSNVLQILSNKDIESLYHYHYKEEQGNETIKTYFMHRNVEKGYHIDYIFTPIKFIKFVKDFKVGVESWLKHSDHLPLICELTSKYYNNDVS